MPSRGYLAVGQADSSHEERAVGRRGMGPLENEDERREFYTTYAAEYERIYAAVDYDAQVDFYAALFQRFVPHAAHRFRLRSLDLCCGTGRHAAALVRRGWETTACDLSPAMTVLTRAKSNRIRVARADLRALPFRGPYDLVLCSCNALIESRPLDALRSTLEQIYAVLASDGLLVFDITDCRIGLGTSEAHGIYEDGPLHYEVRWTWQEGVESMEVHLRYALEGRLVFEDRHLLCAVTFPDLLTILREIGFQVVMLEDDTDAIRPWSGESLRAIFVARK